MVDRRDRLGGGLPGCPSTDGTVTIFRRHAVKLLGGLVAVDMPRPAEQGKTVSALCLYTCYTSVMLS